MNIKEDILKIIHKEKKEPIVRLVDTYNLQLTDEALKEEFLSVMKNLVLNGSENEQVAGLYVIDRIKKVKESKDVIKEFVERFDYKKNEEFIIPLLSICAALSSDWSISFIKRIIKHYKPETKEYVSYFDIGLRNILDTIYWKDVIGDIKWVIENYDDSQTIDFVAYFIWKQGKDGLKELLNLIKSDKSVYDRVCSLQSEITGRYASHYGAFEKKWQQYLKTGKFQ
jgi:hypothetical protein